MFNHIPYGAYSNPYGYSSPGPSYSPNPDYFRTLADERAAREQYRAARRAQEQARQRAARARLARQAYSPYDSFFDHDYEPSEDYDVDDSGLSYLSGGYAPMQRRRHAMMEEQRRREALEQERAQERERLRLEEERRKLEEERRLLQEERFRQLLAEEQRRKEEEEWNRRRMNQFDPFFPNFFGPEDDETDLRMGRTPLRAQTISPTHRRQVPSQPQGMRSQRSPQSFLQPNLGSRSSSVPPRPPRSPQPHSPVSHRQQQSAPVHAASPKAPSPQVPSLAPQVKALPEEHDAALKIQNAFRAHAARAQAMRKITELREKFGALRTRFCFPSALIFVLPDGSHVSVPVHASSLQRASDVGEEEEQELESKRPELAYVSGNAPVHMYLEQLGRVLSALDAVESGGDEEIREKRKALVREVEGEAERVERCAAEVWMAWAGQGQEVRQTPAAETTSAPAGLEGERMEVEPPQNEQAKVSSSQAESRTTDSSAQPATDATPTIVIEDTEPTPAEPDTVVTAQTQSAVATPEEREPEVTIEVVEAEPEPEEDIELCPDGQGERMQVEAAQTVPAVSRSESSGPVIESSIPVINIVGAENEDEEDVPTEHLTTIVEEPQIPAEPEDEELPEMSATVHVQEQPAPSSEQTTPVPEVRLLAEVPQEPASSPATGVPEAPAPMVEVATTKDGGKVTLDEILHLDAASQTTLQLQPEMAVLVEPAQEDSTSVAKEAEVAHTGGRPASDATVGEAREPEQPATPSLSSSHLDGESEAEGECPGTPPPADMPTMSPPAIVVSATDAHPQETAVQREGSETKRLPEKEEPRMNLVSREWEEVEQFDLF